MFVDKLNGSFKVYFHGKETLYRGIYIHIIYSSIGTDKYCTSKRFVQIISTIHVDIIDIFSNDISFRFFSSKTV